MLKLRAKCQHITGNTQHWIGVARDGDGKLIGQTLIGPPEYVEIVEDKHGYFLLRYDGEGDCLADSWFESLEQTKRQAKFEYEIDEQHWETIE